MSGEYEVRPRIIVISDGKPTDNLDDPYSLDRCNDQVNVSICFLLGKGPFFNYCKKCLCYEMHLAQTHTHTFMIWVNCNYAVNFFYCLANGDLIHQWILMQIWTLIRIIIYLVLIVIFMECPSSQFPTISNYHDIKNNARFLQFTRWYNILHTLHYITLQKKKKKEWNWQLVRYLVKLSLEKNRYSTMLLSLFMF